jgi:hypothetical protein
MEIYTYYIVVDETPDGKDTALSIALFRSCNSRFVIKKNLQKLFLRVELLLE